MEVFIAEVSRKGFEAVDVPVFSLQANKQIPDAARRVANSEFVFIIENLGR